jgi:glutamate/tyrosine decarboxylase-like PLP-dependent enzyme
MEKTANVNSRSDERSLDPESWDALRALGHRMVDDMLDYQAGVRDRPAWRPLPEATRRRFRTPAPAEGLGAEAVYEEFREHVLPYPAGNIHPRFWGWVKGAGTPTGMLAELLAGAMNTNAWGNEQAASEVEAQVLAWFAELFGLPADSTGVLTTGGSVANLVGLCVAREACGGFDAEGAGWPADAPAPVLYCSTETHTSVDKAARLLGLGAASVRKVPVGDDYAIDVAALRAAIAADVAAGRRPFCLVANVGTVNTGAVDDVAALADLAAEHGAWLHVDGAFGALAVLAPEHAALRDVLARADSIAFDLHKWLSVPYDCGGVLVRHPATHRAALSARAGYLAHEARGAASGHAWFNELGLELSRGFRALKAWFVIREHGFARLGGQIAQNLRQARALAALVEQAPDLELLAPVALNVVCFRVRPPGVEEAALDALNREVLLRLQERGIAVPSGTRLRGRFAIRVANVNHRSRMEDFHALLAAVRAIAAEIADERPAAPPARSVEAR